MKIVVCIRRGPDGELSPFDACAYEAALAVTGAEVTLLMMAPRENAEFLAQLTRLGAARAILLSDPAFAGADTLATAYALLCAIKKLDPDLVFCGRQTLVGDTGQVGPMLATLLGIPLLCGVMGIEKIDGGKVTCTTRGGAVSAPLPALLTIERINTLRFPSLFSSVGAVEAFSLSDIAADPAKCGLRGSPTRVLATFENSAGRRKCKFVDKTELAALIKEAKGRPARQIPTAPSTGKLKTVFSVGVSPLPYAKTVCDGVTVLEDMPAEELVRRIEQDKPDAVLFGSDPQSKALAAKIAATLSLGLCADCTRLEAVDGELIMYRPALSGSILAKIKSLTRPALATVRTVEPAEDTVIAVGAGAKDALDAIKTFAASVGACIGASRKAVDAGIAPYAAQVGLTGRTVSPNVYVAVGISGAVQHIVGMQRAGTVIAINPDRAAPIFDYADYGILAKAREVFPNEE